MHSTAASASEAAEAVKNRVIASQCAHWRGNPFLKMFPLSIHFSNFELFWVRIPTALKGLGMTPVFKIVLFDTLSRLRHGGGGFYLFENWS